MLMAAMPRLVLTLTFGQPQPAPGADPDLALKACGGAAFSRQATPIERLFRDARAGWVMAPTVDHLDDFIGKALTGLPLF